jgi:hypothetical protein
MIRVVNERTKSGYAICPAATIDGIAVPERSYGIVEHIVVLEGYSDAVLQHDYLALLAIPGGIYRPLTPSEQNALRLKQEAAATVEE